MRRFPAGVVALVIANCGGEPERSNDSGPLLGSSASSSGADASGGPATSDAPSSSSGGEASTSGATTDAAAESSTTDLPTDSSSTGAGLTCDAACAKAEECGYDSCVCGPTIDADCITCWLTNTCEQIADYACYEACN